VLISPTEDIVGIWLAWVLLARGDLPGALKAFEQISLPDLKLAGLAAVYHAMGRGKDSDEAMQKLETNMFKTSPYAIAQAHAYRGEFDAALTWLDRSWDAKDGWLSLAKGDPAFTQYRDNPRYRAWLHKIGLPD